MVTTPEDVLVPPALTAVSWRYVDLDDAYPSSPGLLIESPHLVAVSTLAGGGAEGAADVVGAGLVITESVGVPGDVDDHGSVE